MKSRSLRLSLLLLLPIWFAACSAPESTNGPLFRVDPAQLDEEVAFREVDDFVALGPRVANTPGAERAAHYLLERLTALGVEGHIDTFDDPIHNETGTFHNVIGVIPGDLPRWLILGSHFDTLDGIEGFVGANDSGSSTGLLLELGRVLNEAARDAVSFPTFILAFFDGEEAKVRYGPRDGLHGSRHYVRRLLEEGKRDKIRATIVLDMVGDRDLTLTLPRNVDPDLLRLTFRAAAEEGVREKFSLAPGAILDDHVPFLQAGIPAMNIIDFEFGSAPGLNDYWHTLEDTMDKISAESLGIVGRVTLRMVQHLVEELQADARRGR